ncbi:MAG: molybdenum cofactor guanylyltransferase MobA [Dongiaceae bacterium]
MQIKTLPPCIGILLAGGLARRLGGGDKGLRLLGGRPMLAHAIDRLAPQVDTLILNANGDKARFASLALPVIADSVAGFPGPLAGILAGMEWVGANRPDCRWIATAGTDYPFLPRDLVARLGEQMLKTGAEIALASSAGRLHPIIGLWPVAQRDALRRAIEVEGLRKVEAWAGRYKTAVVDFAAAAHDPFFNVNTPEDLLMAEAVFAQIGDS